MGFVVSEGTVVSTAGSSTILADRPYAITNYTGFTQAYETIYRNQPNVRTVVDFLARNIGQLHRKLYERVDDTTRRYVRDHPVDRLMRRPNHRTSRYAFARALVSDLGIFDNFVALKVRSGSAMALLRIPPQYVEPVGANWLFPDGFRMLTIQGQPVYPWESFVHIAGYNPLDARWGLSPIETLRRLLAEDTAAGEFREQLWSRGARATGTITRPAEAPAWSDAARTRFLEGWAAQYAGAGPDAGGTAILEDGMTFARDSFDAKEMEYLGARKLTRAEVAAAYHVDPSQVGIMESANIASDASAHSRLYQDTLGPYLSWIDEELALQLIPDVEPDVNALDRFYLESDLGEKLKGDFLAEAEATSRAVGAPYLTRNEARARRNLPPLDGGDDLIVPLNVTAGGRASPADTAPGTPGLGQAARPRDRRTRALSRAKASADDDDSHVDHLPAELEVWVAAHAEHVADFVDRQAASVLSKLGRGDAPLEAFGVDDAGRQPRWDTELADLLTGLALEVSPIAAAPVAADFGVDYDVELATAWLATNAGYAAINFNEATYRSLADVYPIDLELTPELTYSAILAGAAAARVSALAVDRVSGIANFSRHEAAQQGGATTKTWLVRSARPRPSHAALSNVTIPFDGVFANGGKWPHDPALSAAENARCTCGISFTEASVTEL